jgi:hypothetical protein
MLDDRKCEGSSLPGTSLRDSEEISAREDEGDGFLLYRCRLSVAFFGEGFQEGLDESEIREQHSIEFRDAEYTRIIHKCK